MKSLLTTVFSTIMKIV